MRLTRDQVSLWAILLPIRAYPARVGCCYDAYPGSGILPGYLTPDSHLPELRSARFLTARPGPLHAACCMQEVTHPCFLCIDRSSIATPRWLDCVTMHTFSRAIFHLYFLTTCCSHSCWFPCMSIDFRPHTSIISLPRCTAFAWIHFFSCSSPSVAFPHSQSPFSTCNSWYLLTYRGWVLC
jgi:hypothetical protein